MNRSQEILDLFEAASCPLSSMAYGGLPSGGGYSDYTEYEVGARIMAEALHCVLGSLERAMSTGSKDFLAAFEYGERQHIEEEIEIIENTLSNYSHPKYIERLFQGNPHEKESVESIKNTSYKLGKITKDLSKKLDKDMDKAVYGLAYETYRTAYELARQMLESIKDWPDSTTNAFKSTLLKVRVKTMRYRFNDLIKVVQK